MTDVIATVTGLWMALATAATSETALDAIPALSGTALLVWIVIWQGKEINKLRERNRELADKCKGCTLAKTANEVLIEHAHDKHEDCD